MGRPYTNRGMVSGVEVYAVFYGLPSSLFIAQALEISLIRAWVLRACAGLRRKG